RPCRCRRPRTARQTRPPGSLALHLGTPSTSAAFYCRLPSSAPVVGRSRNPEAVTFGGRPTGLPLPPFHVGAAATDSIRQTVSARPACRIPAYLGRHGGRFGGSLSDHAANGQGADPLPERTAH